MSRKTVFLVDSRAAYRPPIAPDSNEPFGGTLTDTLARPLHDLRISVTDRCNFRCVYCMPRDVFGMHYPFLPHEALLNFEEITRLARLFIEHGVKKIRLTGGEPLLRKDLERLVEMLARLTTRDGTPLDLTLTTNGSLLAKKAQALKDAGLQRVTVSLDGLNDAVVRTMNDVDFAVEQVLEGIAEARRVGLSPVKVNMVVKRGTNDDQILPMARHFRHSGMIVRFVEYMDVGASNGWRIGDVLPSAEVLERLHAEWPLTPIDPNYPGETAERWRYTDGAGEIGVISSVTRAFCSGCTRVRLSAEGKLYLCLYATGGQDLRSLLRGGYTDPKISAAIAHIWRQRDDQYSKLRCRLTTSSDTAGSTPTTLRKIEMSYIGG